jgi:hypothetical protein
MLDTQQVAHFERSDASMFARTPATIPALRWDSNEDWEDFRTYLEQRLLSGRNWRTSWWMHWGMLAANILPRRYHWLITPSQMTRGLPINQDVVDSTPAQAVAVAAAGMMDGLSSPTKIWFKFKPAVPGFEPDTAGQRWINEVQHRVYEILAGSNYYDCKHQQYEDQIVFGTAPMFIYEHRKSVINCQNSCAGEYYCYTAADHSIGSIYREFTQTVTQIVEGWGPKAVEGTDVATMWNTKGANLDSEKIVAHSIEPNFPVSSQDFLKPRLGVIPGGYAYREVYWLRGMPSPRPLSFRGFHEQPFMCPRWNTRSNDPYGRSPGMDALPDVRQLHQMVRRLNEATDKGIRPPMQADVAMKNEPSSLLPGRVTYVPNLTQSTGMKPMYEVDVRFIEFLWKIIEDTRQHVREWFFNDVFMMISQMEGVQPRNELELNERRGEKLLRLGPVIERNLREDAKGINRVLAIMTRRGMIPPQPASLKGIPIEIAFVSKLALIQQAAVTGSMERVLAMAGKMEGVMPGTLDNISKDKFIRDYGEKLDFPPADWSDEQTMAQTRQSRDQAQQKALQAHQIKELTPALAAAGKNLGDTDVGGGQSALQAMLGTQSAGRA